MSIERSEQALEDLADLPLNRYPHDIFLGRIWALRRDYPQIEGLDDLLAWGEHGTVRVLLAHWIEPDGPGRCALLSEGRIKPVDGAAGLRLRALWAAVGHFERLIGGEVLPIAAGRAELPG